MDDEAGDDFMASDRDFQRVVKEAREEGRELFTPAERLLVEAFVEDPDESPGYELLRGMLCWSDELPESIDGVLYWKVVLLQSYRSMMWRPEHHQSSDHGRGWFEACRMAWQKAQASGVRWIGFLPSRTDPAHLATLITFEKAALDDL